MENLNVLDEPNIKERLVSDRKLREDVLSYISNVENKNEVFDKRKKIFKIFNSYKELREVFFITLRKSQHLLDIFEGLLNDEDMAYAMGAVDKRPDIFSIKEENNKDTKPIALPVIGLIGAGMIWLISKIVKWIKNIFGIKNKENVFEEVPNLKIENAMNAGYTENLEKEEKLKRKKKKELQNEEEIEIER